MKIFKCIFDQVLSGARIFIEIFKNMPNIPNFRDSIDINKQNYKSTSNFDNMIFNEFELSKLRIIGISN